MDFTDNEEAIAVKFPIFDKSGLPLGFAGIYIDISTIIKKVL
jgi:hypothetical protein